TTSSRSRRFDDRRKRTIAEDTRRRATPNRSPARHENTKARKIGTTKITKLTKIKQDGWCSLWSLCSLWFRCFVISRLSCFRVLPVCGLLLSAVACAHPTDRLDAQAERYVRIVLALGERDPDSLDFYAGPTAWRADARRAFVP